MTLYARGETEIGLGRPTCQREVLAPVDERRGLDAIARLRL
jgi:hypothetical protein